MPPEKSQQIIDDIYDCFRQNIKMEYQKITNLLGNILMKYQNYY